MQLSVTVKRLNKRSFIPWQLPEPTGIVGQVIEGFTFEGVEVSQAEIPNPAIGKWYKDRDGYFYWGGGVMEVSRDFEFAERRGSETAFAEAVTAAIEPSKLGWGLKMLHIQEFWELAGNMGNDVNIAILDTGISSSHPDFNYSTMKHFNVLDGSNNTEDTDGHGTHVAGIAASQGKEIFGSAPDANYIIIKVADKVGTWKIEHIGDGIKQAVRMGADIISISGEFHRLNTKLDLLRDAVLHANQNGVVIVAAAGNDSSTEPTDYYPAAFDECISVGSIKEDKTRADDSRLSTKLDIVSPGYKILSTWREKTYKVVSGTSQATPLITGIIAVLKSYARKQKQVELSPGEIYILLTKSADDAGQSGHDVAYGFGIVNPSKALNSI